jgi:hypothetical protein
MEVVFFDLLFLELLVLLGVVGVVDVVVADGVVIEELELPLFCVGAFVTFVALKLFPFTYEDGLSSFDFLRLSDFGTRKAVGDVDGVVPNDDDELFIDAFREVRLFDPPFLSLL